MQIAPRTQKALVKAVAVKKVIKFSKKAVGAVTYSKVAKGSAKRLSVNAKNGKVIVAKKTKAGIYRMKVDVTAAGNGNYEPVSQRVVVKVKVKARKR